MNVKIIDYGRKVIAQVELVKPGIAKDPLKPAATFLVAGGEGYFVMGVQHEIAPVAGMQVEMEFRQGGPVGGFWKIMQEIPKPPEGKS